MESLGLLLSVVQNQICKYALMELSVYFGGPILFSVIGLCMASCSCVYVCIFIYGHRLHGDPWFLGYGLANCTTADSSDTFYDQLQSVVSVVAPRGMLLVLGGFNTLVGSDFQSWRSVIGPHGMDNCNDNEQLGIRVH